MLAQLQNWFSCDDLRLSLAGGWCPGMSRRADETKTTRTRNVNCEGLQGMARALWDFAWDDVPNGGQYSKISFEENWSTSAIHWSMIYKNPNGYFTQGLRTCASHKPLRWLLFRITMPKSWGSFDETKTSCWLPTYHPRRSFHYAVARSTCYTDWPYNKSPLACPNVATIATSRPRTLTINALPVGRLYGRWLVTWSVTVLLVRRDLSAERELDYIFRTKAGWSLLTINVSVSVMVENESE